jgi:hypothetical protein
MAVLKSAKDEPFGGQSLTLIASSIERVRPQTCLAGQAAVPLKDFVL